MSSKNKRTIIIAVIIMLLPLVYFAFNKGDKSGSGTYLVIGAIIIAGIIEIVRDIMKHKSEYRKRYEDKQAKKAGIDPNAAKLSPKKAYEAELNKKRNAKKHPKKLN